MWFINLSPFYRCFQDKNLFLKTKSDIKNLIQKSKKTSLLTFLGELRLKLVNISNSESTGVLRELYLEASKFVLKKRKFLDPTEELKKK